MNDAVKILQAKLANGDISEDEYKRKLALISEHKGEPPAVEGPSTSPENPSAQTVHPLWGWGGIVCGITLYVIISKTVTRLISKCVEETGDIGMCSQYATDHNIVTLAYLISAASFVVGAYVLYMGKKAG